MTSADQSGHAKGADDFEEYLQELARAGATADFIERLRKDGEPIRRSWIKQILLSYVFQISVLVTVLAAIWGAGQWAILFSVAGALLKAMDLWLDRRFHTDGTPKGE